MAITDVKKVIITSKKDLVCEACNEVIASGEEFARVTWRLNGASRKQILCAECSDVIEEFIDDTGTENYHYDDVRAWWYTNKCSVCTKKAYRCRCLDHPEDCVSTPLVKCHFLADGMCESGAAETCAGLASSVRCAEFSPEKKVKKAK